MYRKQPYTHKSKPTSRKNLNTRLHSPSYALSVYLLHSDLSNQLSSIINVCLCLGVASAQTSDNFLWTRVRWISVQFKLSLWRFLPPPPHQYSQDYGGGGGGEEEDSKHSSQRPWGPVRGQITVICGSICG